MRRSTATVLGIFIAMTLMQMSANRHRETYAIKESEASTADSIPGIVTFSMESPEASLFDGLIPCSPQAAALARYAEYPVSLTTGIPDISIPLYEIRMGDFTLPISISYHASGARPDEVPSCVGLGWTLNAGGAVTRTILGGPDIELNDMRGGDYSYYRMSRIDSLIQDVKDCNVDGPLRELINPEHSRDSESDRYCFNAGGHVGIFRYSHNDHKYVCLDRSSCILESFGSGENSYFMMYCPDNTKYRFSVHEKTGSDPGQESPRFTTAWYVSQIHTPYGDINFKYRDLDDRFYVRHTSTCYRSGYYPRHESPDINYYEFDIKKYESSETNVYFWQKLVSSIEWNGNTVEFEYAAGNSDDLNMRLAGMTVKSGDGTTVKTVTFGNDVPWKSGTEPGRRVLSRLDDSVEGRYAFTYFTDNRLPNVIKFGNPPRYTDSWGYYNGGDGPVISRDVAEWLRYDPSGKFQAANTHWRDRSPKLESSRLGVLKTVTFPTGGELTFAYELNELGGVKHGGLRVASTSLREGGKSLTTKYRYSDGVLPQMPPDTLSKHLSYLRIHNAFDKANPRTLQYRTAYSSPVRSAFSKSAPVLYTKVTEEHPDGRYTVYEYDPLDNYVYPDRTDWHHPSSYPEALTDRGLNEPVLKAKSLYSASGSLQCKETNTYLNKEIATIETGVRLISVIDYYIYEGGETGYEDPEDEFPEGVGYEQLLIRQTTARQNATVLKSTVTEDFTTGVLTTLSYTYDPQYRTLRPLTETVVNSDGTSLVTRYEYPFHRTGVFYRSMVEDGYADWRLSTSLYSGESLISRNETEYMDIDGQTFSWVMPSARSSWSAPTSSSLQSPPATLPERECITAYNNMGRPLAIKVNDTDVTSFIWDTSGSLLTSSTAPGGMTTSYTHKRLFGLTSVKQPNGYTARYSYNSAGMLASVADDDGALESYSYSITNHPLASMTGGGNSVTTTRFLNVIGPKTVKSRQYHDGLGRPHISVQGGVNTDGKYLYSAVSYDASGRVSQTVLPSVGGTAIESKTFNQVRNLSGATYSDQYAWSETTYDAFDRPVKVTTPGDAWHSAGKARTTQYIANAANSVRLYRAPMNEISLVEDGYYAAKTLQGIRTVDEDGNEMTVYTDRLGRKVLERRGPESQKGRNDTYFVYNALGQLRYVLSPGYELSGYKDKFAYEYRYDEHGNVVKKIIPGAGYTQYWYDRAGRLAFMQDPNLRERGEHRFFIYDRAGRLTLQGVSASCNRNIAVNFADYKGATQGFASTGYTLEDASRLQQVTLETVNYYDTYAFAPVLSNALVRTGTVAAMGLQTGSVVYGSDRSRTVSAFYYDAKGNIIESREVPSLKPVRTTVNTYTYTGQPLKTTVTEGSVTIITENTYDASSGLLTATDVTVNDVRQRVSAVAYDNLGRIASVTRGAGGKGGKVEYAYNIHGQTTGIKGPGLTQNLHYADGPGKNLYNGSVSAMTWTMGTDTRVRGYKYSYNGYGWLTAAEYGENADLWANQHRYTERFLDFMPNGGIRRLQRHGLKADGMYGKVDNLHIYYDGNRITGVLDDALPVTQNGSMDFPVSSRETVLGYNDWGALVKDQGRGISNISYDRFGNPLRISYSNGAYTEYVYSATGKKLRMTHGSSLNAATVGLEPYGEMEFAEDAVSEPMAAATTATSVTEYRGNVIYRDGKVDMVLFPGGYATINGTSVTFHYYTQDYLGNNRAVINGTTGAIEQTTAYYPYGGVIADLGHPTGGQPYRFGAKELVTANGLNEYDFGARQYYSSVPGFTRPDQHSEYYYWLSPYIYCANDPVNFVDPTGMDWVASMDDENRKTWQWVDGISTMEDALDNGYVDFLEAGSILDNARIGEGDLGSIYLGYSASDISYTVPNCDVTPWQVGVEWLTGKGPRHREFKDGDRFSEQLRQHEHYQQSVQKALERVKNGDMSGSNNNVLGGIEGVGKYIKDYSTLFTGGLTGNLAATYLGSYSLDWTASIDKGDTILYIKIVNSSTMQSATRPPVFGYKRFWQNSVGKLINSTFSSGPGSKTTQTFFLTDTIHR